VSWKAASTAIQDCHALGFKPKSRFCHATTAFAASTSSGTSPRRFERGDPASGCDGYRNGSNVNKLAGQNCEADEQASSQPAETMRTYNPSIDSEELKKLSVLQPWGTVAALALDWAVIARLSLSAVISAGFGLSPGGSGHCGADGSIDA
jgi:hypothetical protein